MLNEFRPTSNLRELIFHLGSWIKKSAGCHRRLYHHNNQLEAVPTGIIASALTKVLDEED